MVEFEPRRAHRAAAVQAPHPVRTRRFRDPELLGERLVRHARVSAEQPHDRVVQGIKIGRRGTPHKSNSSWWPGKIYARMLFLLQAQLLRTAWPVRMRAWMLVLIPARCRRAGPT